MKITYKKKVINVINNKRDLEKFIIENNIYKYFKNLSYFNDKFISDLISEYNEIGIKEFKNVFLRKIINDKNRFSNNFWLIRGYDEKESTDIIHKMQKSNSKLSVNKLKKLKYEDEKEWAKKKNTRIEFWIEKCDGDIDEAIKLYSERQKTFTLKKCIKKYGKVKGEKKFNDRQKRWIKSIYSNLSSEEINKFHKSRAITLEKCVERHGKEKGTKIYKDYILKHNSVSHIVSSKWSYNIIKKLEKKFNLDGYYKSENNKEYFLRSKENIYFYDYCVPKYNFIIEFNGEHIHPNKEKLNENEWNKWKQAWTNKSADECYNYDNQKNNLATENDYELLIVWYSDKKVFNKCVNFINKKINERNRN